MGAEDIKNVWTRRDCNSNYIDISEHRSRKDIQTRSCVQECERNITPTHVTCPSQTGLPITGTPIPCGIAKCWLKLEQLPYSFEIPVRLSDELFDET